MKNPILKIFEAVFTFCGVVLGFQIGLESNEYVLDLEGRRSLIEHIVWTHPVLTIIISTFVVGAIMLLVGLVIGTIAQALYELIFDRK